ncbi:MAG: TRAP transporter small permease [Anaerovoracaceae bacterium]
MENRNIFTKISDIMCKVERTVTWVAFAAMLALLLIQVICRYLLELPLAWAEELIRYSYIAVSFLGAVVALRERSHISIDILPSVIEKKIKDEGKRELIFDAVDIFANLVQVGLFIALSVWMVKYTIDLDARNQITTANQWPMWIMCMPVTISCILMVFHGLLNVLETIVKLCSMKKTGKAVA